MLLSSTSLFLPVLTFAGQDVIVNRCNLCSGRVTVELNRWALIRALDKGNKPAAGSNVVLEDLLHLLSWAAAEGHEGSC